MSDTLLKSALAALRAEVRHWNEAGRPGGGRARWPVRLGAAEAEALLAEFDRRGNNEQRFAEVRELRDRVAVAGRELIALHIEAAPLSVPPMAYDAMHYLDGAWSLLDAVLRDMDDAQ